MIRIAGCLVASLLVVAVAAFADAPPPDPLAENFFPPELLMRHAAAIQLTAEQQISVKAEIQQAQQQFVDLQWDLQMEMGRLLDLVRQGRVPEEEALVQVDRVLEAERAIKRTQITLLVRLKNLLSREQQERLSALRGRGS